jgi:hypothetical protein
MHRACLLAALSLQNRTDVLMIVFELQETAFFVAFGGQVIDPDLSSLFRSLA